MKAFLYARVSTDDQNAGMQLAEMRELARRRGCEVEEFTDAGLSAAAARRPEFERMMKLVRRGKADMVIVYRFDRFARSVQHLVNALEEFRAQNIQFVSVHEAIDTTTPTGKFAFTVFAAVAEFERELIRERTRSGIAHARAQGKQIGRPRLELDIWKIAARRATGQSWEAIASELGVSDRTLRRFLAPAKRVSKSAKAETVKSTTYEARP